jgi:DMSO/TMAO reductase YedYZ molybdopterin-dependent catalytic subunit
MSDLVSRRKLITVGLGAAAGVSGLAIAAKLADRYGLIPPDHGGIFGAGETLTYAAQRILTSHHSLAREFNRSEISKVIPVNGKPPETEPYRRLLAGNFADWRLRVDGLVARPTSFSLAELKRYPSRTNITHQACEEGWSFIAEWTGVRLSYVLNLAGVLPQAKYVVFFGFDTNFDAVDKRSIKGKWNSIDMADAWHPQTLLAYGMNGKELPLPHGAPVRLRLPRQLGGKSTKYLALITVTDTVQEIGKGFGAGGTERGLSWYAGI